MAFLKGGEATSLRAGGLLQRGSVVDVTVAVVGGARLL